MIENRANQRLRNASTAILGNDEDVHQVGEHSAVLHDASECDLLSPHVYAKTQRVLDRPLNDAAPSALGPVRGLEERMNHVDVETGLVRRDLNLALHRSFSAVHLACRRSSAARASQR